MGNHRGASSDANAERLGFSRRIILWQHKSETAKSLLVCKAVSEMIFILIQKCRSRRLVTIVPDKLLRQFCSPQAITKLSVLRSFNEEGQNPSLLVRKQLRATKGFSILRHLRWAKLEQNSAYECILWKNRLQRAVFSLLAFFSGGGYNYHMTPEQVKQLIDIYDEAIKRLQDLQLEKQHIVKEYIKQLENQKVQALKDTLLTNHQ